MINDILQWVLLALVVLSLGGQGVKRKELEEQVKELEDTIQTQDRGWRDAWGKVTTEITTLRADVAWLKRKEDQHG